jgi:putative transposase
MVPDGLASCSGCRAPRSIAGRSGRSRGRAGRGGCGRRWTPALVAAVEGLRADNPVWGKRKRKRKLGPILRQAGHAISDATVGRILAHLIRLGQAVPAPVFRRPTRAAARRLRDALKARRPGEAVQVDALSLAFPDGKGVKQFTAVDRLSRCTVAMAAWRATAARFLDKLVAELPFKLTAIQIDGGSEFMAEFEAACQQKGIAAGAVHQGVESDLTERITRSSIARLVSK